MAGGRLSLTLLLVLGLVAPLFAQEQERERPEGQDWREKMRQRLQQMSAEDREKFKEMSPEERRKKFRDKSREKGRELFKGRKKGKRGMHIPLHDPRFEKMMEIAWTPEDEIEDKVRETLAQTDGVNPDELMNRLRGFRKRLRNEAQGAAEKMKLDIEGRENEFIEEFWKKRLEMEKALRKKIEPLRKELSSKMREELKTEFGG